MRSAAEEMEQTWRWYGPDDPVRLAHVKQTGATGIVTALHGIPTGDVWSVEAIRARQRVIEAAGLVWSVVESVPVHESIKRGAAERDGYIANYQQTLRNLGECGLHILCYNFMPVLDWTRTELDRRWPDGSEALAFDVDDFAAFELHILRRPGAETTYDPASRARALRRFEEMSQPQRDALSRAVLAGLPGGTTGGYTAEQLQAALDSYQGINETGLRSNLVYFLQRVVPVAEEAGVFLAIHPDDPPCPLLGLPRVVSCDAHIEALLTAVPSKHNGLTFCVGSYGSSPHNKVEEMAQKHAHRVYFVHLRNVKRLPQLHSTPDADAASLGPDDAIPSFIGPGGGCGARASFVESDHLDGDVDMYSLARTFTREAARRRDAAEPSAACRMPWRPDHGHRMMHDLDGEERDEGAVGGVTGGAAGGVVGGLGGAVGAARPPRKTNPGYTAIGRMRGMAEIRGLMHAVLRADAEARSRGANEGEEGGGGGGREAQAGTEGEGVRKRPRGEGSC